MERMGDHPKRADGKRAEAFDFYGHCEKVEALIWQLFEVTEVLEDRNFGAKQDSMDGTGSVSRVIDIERIDPD